MANDENVFHRDKLFQISWRRVDHCDVPEIMKLFRDALTEELFGDVNVAQLIELSYLSLVQLEHSGGNIIACLVLCDYPNVPALPRCCWTEWLRQLYRLERASEHDTLFVHLLVWDSTHTHEFLRPLLYSAFMSCPRLQNIIIVVPPGAKTYDILDEYFVQIFPQLTEQFGKVQTIMLCMRQQLVSRLKVRKAIEEDNDDLVPILDRTSRLRDQFGEFFISDLIRSSDETRNIIVAEVAERAVGMVCVSSRVDYTWLNEVFQLEPFKGLKRPVKVSTESCSADDQPDGPEGQRESDPDVRSVQDEDAAVASEITHEFGSSSGHENNTLDLGLEVTESAGRVLENGVANAFVIEVFSLHEDLDERFSIDLLEAAFDCFPELDYCVVNLPSVYSLCPLLEHFVRVPSRTVCCLVAELYVAHRNSFLSELVVRRAVQEDHPSLEALLGRVEQWDAISSDLAASVEPDETALQSFVATSEGSIVGLAIISGREDVSYLWAHYRLERYTVRRLHPPEQHGLVHHLVLSPAFNCHARDFMAEVHRQSDVTCLYHLLPAGTLQQGSVTVLGYMIPVQPRHTIKYDLSQLTGIEPRGHVLGPRLPCALYHMNKRFSGLRKTTVSIRIIVISMSATALAFLENLLFGPWCVHLTFFNVCVVSPDGLPEPVKRGEQQFLPQRSRFSPDYLSLLALPTWVNFVYGRITDINRQKKNVCVNHDSYLPYDYLLFFNDEEFLYPDCGSCTLQPRTEELGADGQTTEMSVTEIQKIQNVFCINSGRVAINALATLNSITRGLQKYNVIVYGHNVEAFCCVGALLAHGVPGCCISFVEPLTLPAASCFDDQAVYAAVLAEMGMEGVEMYFQCQLHHWTVNIDKPVFTTVAFETPDFCFYMECTAMFYYGYKDVCDELFTVLNRASLVYNGRLVIDARFQTNDPHVLAAGCLTKYTGRLYADRYNHCHYNPVEVGAKVAECMVKFLDPTRSKQEVMDDPELPHVFTQPLVVNCTLPSGVNYLHVRKPGPSPPAGLAANQDHHGVVLVTGSCSDKNYFRLHLDVYDSVDTITCYTDQSIPVSNLIQLYGKHEQLLNNLRTRFNTGRITDFYAYFSEPWTYAIFHDKFESFQEEARNIPLQHAMAQGMSAMEISQLKDQLTDKLVSFISDNLHSLPMYANPMLLKLLHYERETSVLHKNKDAPEASAGTHWSACTLKNLHH